MKKQITLILFCIVTFISNAQVILLQETFQDWKPEAGIAPEPPAKTATGVEYTFTKKLFDGKTEGTFKSNAIVVMPDQSIGAQGRADGNGNPSKGRVIMKGAKTFLELPQLTSIGLVTIKANAGTDQKEFKLQVLNGAMFEDIPNTTTPCDKAVTKVYTFNLSYNVPTTIRIMPTSGSSINIWDIEIQSVQTNKK
ncbi:MAG: hypothetical protein PHV20_08425 [Bacteroidales bacterium]|nr:hypothetical protein [Bacteroidales bacterium]